MLKVLVISVLLWHEIFAGCSDQQPDCSNVFPKENEPPIQPKIFDFHGNYQTIYVNLTFSGSKPDTPSVADVNCVSTIVKPTIRADYKVTDGIGAHKVYANKLTWNNARKACKSDGGQLAVIRSNAEQNIIVELMRDNSVEDAWLGLHDQFQEGDWVSVGDESVAEIGWSKWSASIVPNPDNFNGKQHCARLLRNGNGMDDLECGTTRPFVCKIQT